MRTADATVWVGAVLVLLWAVAALLIRRRGLDRFRPALLPAGLAALAFLGYAGVVDVVADPAPVAALDGVVLGWFVDHRTGWATAILLTATTLGGTLGMTVLAAVGTVVLLLRRRFRDALLVVLVSAGSGLLVTIFKNLYQRPRPPVATRLTVETTYSLPSGHSLGSMATIGVLALVLCLSLSRPAARTAVVAVAAVAVLLIGTSRLYLGVHWLTDVLAGWLLGITWLCACYAAVRARRAPAPAPEEHREHTATS